MDMRGVVLTGIPDQLEVRSIPMPALEPGQALVKIAASPINPSDLVFLKGLYGIQKPLPVVPGFECSGTVVDARGGLYARWLIGKRVACRGIETGHGTWAEYVATSVEGCIPLRSSVSFEQGACLIVNPMTAWALIDIAHQSRTPAIVQTAAHSALGRMITRLAKAHHIDCINIVRRPVDQPGFLNSDSPTFDDDLSALCRQKQPLMAFDAVGGALTGRLLKAMPPNARAIIYGALGGEPCSVDPRQFIFSGKHVEGFWLTQWIKRRSILQNLSMLRDIQSRLSTELETTIQARFPLEKFSEALHTYKQNRSSGKVLFIPS